jgi:hypothetical protein
MIIHEWSVLKQFLRSMRTEPLGDMYRNVLRIQGKESMTEPLPIMVRLIKFMLTISPTTAACERGFSHMKYLKSPLRTQLGQENLSNQLFIMQEGRSLEDFNPDPSIDHWLLNGKGHKHVRGHVLPGQRPKPPVHSAESSCGSSSDHEPEDTTYSDSETVGDDQNND